MRDVPHYHPIPATAALYGAKAAIVIDGAWGTPPLRDLNLPRFKDVSPPERINTMTETTAPASDATNGTSAATPTFTTVAVATLPEKPGKARSAADLRYAADLHKAIADGKQAAQESTVHATTDEATKRAAQLKRLLRPDAPKGKSIGARTVVVDGGFAVAVFLTDAVAKPAAK